MRKTRRCITNYRVFKEEVNKNRTDLFTRIKDAGLTLHKFSILFVNYCVEKEAEIGIDVEESIVNFDFENMLKKYSKGYISDLPYTVRVVFEEFFQSLIGASEEPKLQNKYEIIEAERR